MGEDIIAVVEVTDVFWAIIRFNFTLVQLSIVEEVCLFCLFVYFHQLSVTMNNNKINGRNKTMKKKQKFKEKITPIDDDGAKMHCSLANSVLAPRESTINSQSHESLMSKLDNQST